MNRIYLVAAVEFLVTEFVQGNTLTIPIYVAKH